MQVFENEHAARCSNWKEAANILHDIMRAPLQPPRERLAPKAKAASDHLVDSLIAAIIALSHGQKGKARRILESTPFYSGGRLRLAALYAKRKCDLSVPTDVHTNERYTWITDREVLIDVLQHKDERTGKGISNFGFESLKPLIETNEGENALLRAVDDILNDRLPQDAEITKLLRTFKGVALEKPNPQNLPDPPPRPIAVPEVLKNLANAVQARQCIRGVAATLDPQSYGAGLPDGCAKSTLRTAYYKPCRSQ